MGIGYQRTDRKTIDYDLWFLDNGRIALRGPKVDFYHKDFICFIGAAQTFGRFVSNPFPQQVGNFLEMPALNLGISGAGPEAYLNNKTLRACIERASIVVIQCMSARSVSAGIFRAGPQNYGVLEFRGGKYKGQQMLAADAYRTLWHQYGENAFLKQVYQVQQVWVSLYKELLSIGTGRKFLLWMSHVPPSDRLRASAGKLGPFPHLVTKRMLDDVSFYCTSLIDATSPPNVQPLINKTTGYLEEVFNKEKFPNRKEGTRSLNTYYPTPRDHEIAFKRIVAELGKFPGQCGRYLASAGRSK